LAAHGIADRPGALTMGLSEVAAAWPLGASLAAAAAARGLNAGRRRAALNEALHELRRPLQTLALAAPASAGPGAPIDGTLQLAATALERLEREINGEPPVPRREPVPIQPLLASAASRWRPQAQLGGGALRLRRGAPEAIVIGDRFQLTQALDNLLANAIEHGGGEVEIEAGTRGGRLLIAVRDRGSAQPSRRRARPRRLAKRFVGRSRHGHGLRVVRRAAHEQGGEFELRCSERGAEAILELPLHRGGGGLP
jgi:signal transduction histidine kinase